MCLQSSDANGRCVVSRLAVCKHTNIRQCFESFSVYHQCAEFYRDWTPHNAGTLCLLPIVLFDPYKRPFIFGFIIDSESGDYVVNNLDFLYFEFVIAFAVVDIAFFT